MPKAVEPRVLRSGRHQKPWPWIRSASSRCNTEKLTCGRMPEMQPGPHVEEMEAAIRADGEGLRALLDGDPDRGRQRLREAVARYRASWELAPPRSFGRLVGMLKAAVILGDAAEAAAYARAAVPEADSPPSAYVRAIAALVEDDDDAAARFADGMRTGSAAFGRAADAIAALALADGEA